MDIPTSEKQDWQINLAWRQQVVAFWSISWPAWLASFIPVTLLTNGSSAEQIEADRGLTFLVAQFTFFAFQSILTRRLVRKRYRSFRVEMIRDSDQHSGRFTTREAWLVWLRILWPQLLSLVLCSLIVWRSGNQPPERSFGSLWVLVNFFVAGPIGVGAAMRASYSGFKLQGYGWRFI